MTPNSNSHDSSAAFCRDLVNSIDMTHIEISKLLGINDRTLRRYMSGARKLPYLVQFALECLLFEP